jgi:hypothetical protein
MARLEWDKSGERIYETGDKNLALYVMNDDGTYRKGKEWNGLTSISETPSGAEATDLWADDIKYAVMRSSEQYGGTIEAYQSPIEFDECDGSITNNGVSVRQQKRRAFGLSYVTTVGNDVQLNDYGEKLHLVYNATANPSDRSYSTINDSPEAITFSWEYTTTPIEVNDPTRNITGYKPTACIVITKTQANANLYDAFKEIVQGSASADARLPLPAEVIAYFNGNIPGYVYTELDERPTNWATTYPNYFKKVSSNPDIYEQLHPDTSVPNPVGTTWPDDTYYSRSLAPST